MSRLSQELKELGAQCGELRHALSTRNSEVQHLKQTNMQAQQDIEHLRETVSGKKQCIGNVSKCISERCRES